MASLDPELQHGPLRALRAKCGTERGQYSNKFTVTYHECLSFHAENDTGIIRRTVCNVNGEF